MIVLGSRFQLVAAGNTVVERRRVFARQALEGCERWKPVVTFKGWLTGCRLKFGGEAGYIISGGCSYQARWRFKA